MTIKELEDKIIKANEFYRLHGESLVPDFVYDSWIDELESLDPNNPLLSQVGIEIIDPSRLEKLPIVMASMNKEKSSSDLDKWTKNKKIPRDTIMIITPKYDGLSLCVRELENEAWTRGDGVYGQNSHGHLKIISRDQIPLDIITFGEVIMPRKTFIEEFQEDFSNPRNLVGGQFNKKNPNIDILPYINYVSYGLVGMDFSTKQEQLDLLNKYQKHKVPYLTIPYSEITEEMLKDMFLQWSEEYEIDGLIIEVNDEALRQKLGRAGAKNNPVYACAYKGSFEEVKETTVLGITYKISKRGYVKPVVNIEPTNLDGAVVSNVTGFNARFMLENEIGIGTKLMVKRSGMVIPYIVSVSDATGFTIPDLGVKLEWNSNEIELVTTEITPQQRFMQMVSFFNILDVDNLGEGTLSQFFDNGYDTPLKVLEMTKEQMMELDKIGSRKADIILNAIDAKRNVTLSKMQHASGLFKNLGSRKLKMLENLSDDFTNEEIIAIDGFSDKSALYYSEGIVLYNEWVKPYTKHLNITKTTQEIVSDDLSSYNFVFTGYRDKEANTKIESMGGKISSSVSSKVTHLVMKAKGSGSSKEEKAIKLGITIWDADEFNSFLAGL